MQLDIVKERTSEMEGRSEEIISTSAETKHGEREEYVVNGRESSKYVQLILKSRLRQEPQCPSTKKN